MTFKKKSETLAAAVAAVATTNPAPVKVDLTPESQLPQPTNIPPMPEVKPPLPQVNVPAPQVEAPVSKTAKPCSIPQTTAAEVLSYISNPVRGLESVGVNPHGGINLLVRDTSTGQLVPIAFNKQGLVDLVRFGLEAIANNR